MSDDPSAIFHELLQRQIVFDAAHAELMAAGDVTDDEREVLRTAEREAALALHRCRQAHPEWASWEQQKKLQKEARTSASYSPEEWAEVVARARAAVQTM